MVLRRCLFKKVFGRNEATVGHVASCLFAYRVRKWCANFRIPSHIESIAPSGGRANNARIGKKRS